MTWGIVYYATADGKVPAEEFLDKCPAKVEARFFAVLEAVRDAPPPQAAYRRLITEAVNPRLLRSPRQAPRRYPVEAVVVANVRRGRLVQSERGREFIQGGRQARKRETVRGRSVYFLVY